MANYIYMRLQRVDIKVNRGDLTLGDALLISYWYRNNNYSALRNIFTQISYDIIAKARNQRISDGEVYTYFWNRYRSILSPDAFEEVSKYLRQPDDIILARTMAAFYVVYTTHKPALEKYKVILESKELDPMSLYGFVKLEKYVYWIWLRSLVKRIVTRYFKFDGYATYYINKIPILVKGRQNEKVYGKNVPTLLLLYFNNAYVPQFTVYEGSTGKVFDGGKVVVQAVNNELKFYEYYSIRRDTFFIKKFVVPVVINDAIEKGFIEYKTINGIVCPICSRDVNSVEFVSRDKEAFQKMLKYLYDEYYEKNGIVRMVKIARSKANGIYACKDCVEAYSAEEKTLTARRPV